MLFSLVQRKAQVLAIMLRAEFDDPPENTVDKRGMATGSACLRSGA